MGGWLTKQEKLQYIQRNLQKLDATQLKKAETILKTVFDDIFDDGKIDPDEMKKLTGMGNRLNQYIEWAE